MGKARKSGMSVDVSNQRKELELRGTGRHTNLTKQGDFYKVPIPAFVNAKKPLAVSGGCMGGPIGFNQSVVAIASGDIDISATSGKFAGFVKVQAESGTADDLVNIQNPFFTGQELYLQADTGDTITIKTTGNIDTFDGMDVSLSGDKTIQFIWDNSKWRQIGGIGGGGASFPITPTVDDHGSVGTTTEDIDLSATDSHIHKMTLTGNPTLTFSNPPSSGTQIEFEIEFLQDGTGGRTVTFPASVAETVTVAPGANKVTIITFRTNDGGTTYHAFPSLRGSISLGASSEVFTWTADHSAAGFDLTNIDRLRFASDSGALVSSDDPSILLDASGDMIINIATGDQYVVSIGGTSILNWSPTRFRLIAPNGTTDNEISLFNNDTTPANNDVPGKVVFQGYDSGGVSTFSYGEIVVTQDSVSSSDKEGSVLIKGMHDNALTNLMAFNSPQVAGSNITYRDFLPTTDGTRDIGSDTLKFAEMHTLDMFVTKENDFPNLYLRRDDSTPTDNDVIGKIFFRGDDSANNIEDYIELEAISEVVTSTNESAGLLFWLKLTGTRTKFMSINEDAADDIKIYKQLEMENQDIIGIDALRGETTGNPFIQFASGDINLDTNSSGNDISFLTNNVERGRLNDTNWQFSHNIQLTNSVDIELATGTGSKIGTGTTQKLGFWNATPIAQPSSTGETTGFTAGSGTGVNDDSTFTGNVGSTAYRISDIVKHLKNEGLIAS